MIKTKCFRLILIFFLAFSCFPAKATHIVGGVMNYRYIGNDRYEISLYVYRDCINGVPPLDDPAIIRVWDGVAESYYGFSKPFDDTLPPIQPDPCSRIETPICVNWTRYLDTLILPPSDLGYTIYYQRCCRNNTIQNLTYDSRGYGAMDWGSTYTVNIPPALNGNQVINSSPYFVNYPPVYICVGKPIVYDNSAIDADGDSLAYSLCVPYSGAYPDDPTNIFYSETPPFENVVWESPYSLANVLGGTPLAVNRVTGLLTGTPNTLGQFVVGVCVDEYRNGALLTHTIRDFQFNVVDCNLQIISSFFAPSIQCNDFTVSFQNQSSGATGYKWYFGDGDSSVTENPSHTYRDTGIYTVTLVSYNNITNNCIAQYTQQVSVQFKKIDADFTVSNTSCLKQGDAIQFFDHSTDSLNIISWKWNFSTGDSSSLQNPTLFYNGTAGSITATLLVTSVNGCTSQLTKNITIYKKPSYTLTPVLTKCSNPGGVQIPLVMNGNNIFQWTPSTGLDNPVLQNPTTTANSNITYYVTIKTPQPNGDTCIQRDSVQIKTINTVQINSGDTLKVCNDSIRLHVPVSPGQSVIWSTSNTFSPVIGTTPQISIRQTVPAQKYFVKITAQECEAIDSITVIYNDTIPAINLTDNILQCSNQVILSAAVNYSESIRWSISPDFIPVLSASNTYSTIQIPKTVKYYIRADYRTCSNTDSIRVTIQDTLPLISLDDSLNICGGPVIINSVVRKFTSLIWSTSPTFSPVIGTSQTIFVSQNNPRQVYYLKAFYRDCEKTDSIVVNYNAVVPTIQLADSLFFCSNIISATAAITNAENITWSVNPTFVPVLSTQNSVTTTQLDPLQKYYVKASFSFCSVTDSIYIRTQADLPQVTLADSFFVCADSVRIRGQINHYDSLKWSGDPSFTNVLDTSLNLTILQREAEKTYYIKIYYQDCEITDSILVFYNDTLPSIRLTAPQKFCSDTVFAEASVTVFSAATWAADRAFTQVLGTGLTLQTVQSPGKKWYYFRAAYKSCTATDSIALVNAGISYELPDSEVCQGEEILLDLKVQTAYPFSIVWYINDDTIQTNEISTLTITPDASQTVRFSIDNQNGCAVNDSFNITVHPLPLADATVDKAVIYAGEQMQLNTTQGQGYSYNWTPANLVSDPAIHNPVSSPVQNTLYTIVVYDSNQCSDSDTVSVQVLQYDCKAEFVYIPNAFSPNNDGINDILRVQSTVLKSMHLEIYDRWGHKVFETDDLNGAWDGSYKGQLSQADAYGYYFTGECLQNEKITLKGNITLLR